MKNILQKNSIILYKFILVISIFFLSAILSNNITDFKYGERYTLLFSAFSSLLMLVIVYKRKFNNVNKMKLLVSFLISMYCMKFFIQFNTYKIFVIIQEFGLNQYVKFIENIVGILAIPSLMYFCYLFLDIIYPKIKDFILGLDKIEKNYLKLITIISTIVVIIINLKCTAFFNPVFNGKNIICDVLYTTDSGVLLKDDIFLNYSHSDNDVRQFLFGLCATPFSLLAHILNECMFFMDDNQGYATIMIIFQFILTSISTILLARLLELDKISKIYFYIFFSISFPYLIFNLILEQYAISLFYLIVAIYAYFKCKGNVNYSYICAIGTLTTSGIIFPLITKSKKIKEKIRDILKCFIIFFIVFVFSGQICQVFKFKVGIVELLKTFSGKIDLENRIYRFSQFIGSLIIGGNSKIEWNIDYISYISNVPTSINILGVIIFLLVCVSFFINRKNKVAVISFLWVIFSVILLLFVGWGMPENGLVLYSLYFSWAYLLLVFLLIKSIFKFKYNVVMNVLIILIFIFNFIELFKIISFAIKYY